MMVQPSTIAASSISRGTDYTNLASFGFGAMYLVSDLSCRRGAREICHFHSRTAPNKTVTISCWGRENF
jgi:hypothetical protein